MSVQSHPGRCGRSLQGLGLSHLALPCPASSQHPRPHLGTPEGDADHGCGCLHAVAQLSHLGDITPGGQELLLHCHSPGEELLLLRGAALICSPALGSCAAQLDALPAPNQNMPVKVQLSCPAELQQGQCHREARAEPVCLGSSAGSRGLARPSLLRSCEQGH